MLTPNKQQRKIPSTMFYKYDTCVHARLCPTLCDPMDCSPPDSSVHGIFQARVLDWVVIPFTRETLFWGAPKSLQMVTTAMKLKDASSLEEKL